VAEEYHAHWYGFCLLGADSAEEGRVTHKHQHEIRTGSEQPCRESVQAPYNLPVLQHCREEYPLILRQHNLLANHL
jgi:hypothetical protein